MSLITKKTKKIKIVISDIDGVLTDGGMYYNEKGECLKKFNTKDGMGIELLKIINVKTLFITKETSSISKMRAKKLKTPIFTGIHNKENLLPKICKKYHVEPSEIAYIGDDINDKKIMQRVGFSATPSNGSSSIRKIADYTSKLKGGDGVFRDVADLIINSKK